VRTGYGLYYGQPFINITLFMLQQTQDTLYTTVTYNNSVVPGTTSGSSISSRLPVCPFAIPLWNRSNPARCRRRRTDRIGHNRPDHRPEVPQPLHATMERRIHGRSRKSRSRSSTCTSSACMRARASQSIRSSTAWYTSPLFAPRGSITWSDQNISLVAAAGTTA
jgi:hypothetical protein